MFSNLFSAIETLLSKNLIAEEYRWLQQAISAITEEKTARKLYLNYSLSGAKIQKGKLVDFTGANEQLQDYLSKQHANTVELARIYMLLAALESDGSFKDAVKNLIQIADKSELETFLKYLTFLPNPKYYQFAAVEALRTNISTVFEAITKYNPYPAAFFTDQQWNQMYLKAAFMQLDLSTIEKIDERANADLARIISDYAHERWAASREIDPYFWRPISNFIDDNLAVDIKRLFESTNRYENYAAALVCYYSKLPIAKELLTNYPTLKVQIEEGTLTWKTLKTR